MSIFGSIQHHHTNTALSYLTDSLYSVCGGGLRSGRITILAQKSLASCRVKSSYHPLCFSPVSDNTIQGPRALDYVCPTTGARGARGQAGVFCVGQFCDTLSLHVAATDRPI